MAEYIQKEDGTLELVHETKQMYSEEWKAEQSGDCSGCTGAPTENQNEIINLSNGGE